MDLDALQAGRAQLSATYNGFVVNFEYHPARVGMNLQAALAGATQPPYDVGPITRELAAVLAGWDIQRGGQPVPATAEGIGSLPMVLGSAIGQSIMQDFTDPKSPTTADIPSGWWTPSLATSEPADSSASVQSSPSSSSTPSGPASLPGNSSEGPTPPDA